MKRRSPIALLAIALCGFAIGGIEDGNRLYREGRYREAAAAYRAAIEEDGPSVELHYNLGTTLLQLGELEAAEEQFMAALSAVDPSLRQRTFYNLGSRFLAAGRAAPDGPRRGALLDAAVETYKQALSLDPDDVAAKWNYELALREREQNRQSPQQDQGGGGGGGGEDEDPAQGGGGGDEQADASPAPAGPGE
ncbi:MAG: tetratricopeptide repeat protein, partial [Longimicrobiales bacterium]